MKSIVMQSGTGDRSDMRLQIGAAGAIELTRSERVGSGFDSRMQKETTILRIPADEREKIANFIANAK